MFKFKTNKQRFSFKKRSKFTFFRKKKQSFHFQKEKKQKPLFLFNSSLSNFWKRFLIKLSYFLIFLLFFTLIFIFFFTSFFVIKNINLERENFRVDSGEIVDFLKDYRFRNILLISTSKIENEVKSHFTEYKSITIERIFPNTLNIKVKNFDIIAQVKVYIKADKKFTGTGSNLVETLELKPYEQILALNNVGIVEVFNEMYAELPLIEVLAEQDLPLVQGDLLIEPEKLTLILEAQEKLFQEVKIITNYIQYFPKAREIHLKTDKGFEIWIDFMSPVSEQIDKLKKISNDVDWNENPPKEYIDLRIKNRIIYK